MILLNLTILLVSVILVNLIILDSGEYGCCDEFGDSGIYSYSVELCNSGESGNSVKSGDFEQSGDNMTNLAILVFSGNFGEFCESGHSCETSYSDDSGESSDSNESCYVGESGELIDKVILGFLLIS